MQRGRLPLSLSPGRPGVLPRGRFFPPPISVGEVLQTARCRG